MTVQAERNGSKWLGVAIVAVLTALCAGILLFAANMFDERINFGPPPT
jgi:ATP/ADP translocase